MNIEVSNKLLHGEDVLVRAQGPAKQREVVEQAFGDESSFAVQEEARLRVALGKLLVALAHDIGKVSEFRHVLCHANGVERTVQRNLTRSGAQEVLATQDMGDSHEASSTGFTNV